MLGLRGVPRREIEAILDAAVELRREVEVRGCKLRGLHGRLVVLCFFENSTRTRTSFELAARRMGADVLNFSAQASSAAKGESLLDTARNIYAMSADAVVIRHPATGAASLLARHFPWAVLNAGDGINEHPSQALLDMLTLRDAWGTLQGRTVAIVGDLAHSRVARSNIFGLHAMGAQVLVAGPGTMCRAELDGLPVQRRHRIDEVLAEADAIMMLRIQRERLGRAVLPSAREYAANFGLDLDRLRRARPEVLVLHPGPINRGVELAANVADGTQSRVLTQVQNGVAIRMALLQRALGNGAGASHA
jgi:aspartate carbamoyltransferase catalytic subunit